MTQEENTARHSPRGACGSPAGSDGAGGHFLCRHWVRSFRADPEVVPLADRHYNRQKVGSPQFAPPGRCLVLKTPSVDAFWITSWPFDQYVRHAWAGAWVCSAFRNESDVLSSDLIREAVAATLGEYGHAPELGMITFVDTKKTRKKRDPGRCYLRAGFRNCGVTKGGLIALQLLPADMPQPLRAPRRQGDLFDSGAHAGTVRPRESGGIHMNAVGKFTA